MNKAYFPVINSCKDRCDNVHRVDHVRDAIAEYTGMEVEFIGCRDAASILSSIVEGTTAPVRLFDLLKAMDPDPFWGCMKDDRPYWERVCSALIGIIGVTLSADIPGYKEWHAETFPDWNRG